MWERSKNWFKDRAGGSHAKAWLALLSFAESIVFPIPIDPLLIGILLVNSKRWPYYALLTTLASVLGAVVGYFLGLLFFDTVGQAIISLYGAGEQFASVQELLNKGVFLFTLVVAITPIPFKIFVLSAGFTKANFFLFVLASLLGRAVRMFGVAYLTHKFGARALEITKRYAPLLTTIGLMLVLLYIFVHFYI